MRAEIVKTVFQDGVLVVSYTVHDDNNKAVLLHHNVYDGRNHIYIYKKKHYRLAYIKKKINDAVNLYKSHNKESKS